MGTVLAKLPNRDFFRRGPVNQIINDQIKADYIKKWGNAASIALLDPSCKIFKADSIDGVIGYRDELNCAVVFGDPLCDPKDMPGLAQAFHDFCALQNKKVVYAIISDQFKNVLKQQQSWKMVEMGPELVLNPQQDPRQRTGNYANLLRRKCKRASTDGVSVKEYNGHDPAIEDKIKLIADQWLKGRKGMQMYLVQIDMFASRENKRYFYAQDKNGDILGALMITRLDAHKGWVINLLITTQKAEHYISEIILLATMDALRAEGCQFFSTGVVPMKKLGTIEGFGKLNTLMIRSVYKVVARICKMQDRLRYWKKFDPQLASTYLLFNQKKFKLKDIVGIMRAFHAKV